VTLSVPREILSLEVLHDEVGKAPLVTVRGEDLDHVGRSQRGHGVRLALEALERSRRGVGRGDEHLEGHVPIGCGLVREHHEGCAAAPERTFDHVATAEERALCEQRVEVCIDLGLGRRGHRHGPADRHRAATRRRGQARRDVARGAAVPGLVAGYGERHARETGQRHRGTGLP
jgi:hypothetical protein